MKTPKAQYFSGEVFDGRIIMGQKSTSFDFEEQDLKLQFPGSTQPRSLVEGTDYEIEEGQIVFKKKLSQTGSYKLVGSVTKLDDRNVTTISIDEEFSIIEKPSTATVEAIRMNILYEGLKNPVNVVLPGAVQLVQVNQSESNVTLASTNIAGANFTAKPVAGATEAFIQVRGCLLYTSPSPRD